MLADEIEEIIAGGLNKLGAEENVVVNIIHPDGQRPHGERDVIALQPDSGRLGRAKYGKRIGHILRSQGSFQASSQARAGQGTHGSGVTR